MSDYPTNTYTALMYYVDVVPACAVTTTVGSRQSCGPFFPFLDSTFRYAGVYTAVAVMTGMPSCRQNTLYILVYMGTGRHYVCMTANDGMTAYDGYRGIHAGVTESGVKTK